jgi:RHS repeat-associated protein
MSAPRRRPRTFIVRLLAAVLAAATAVPACGGAGTTPTSKYHGGPGGDLPRVPEDGIVPAGNMISLAGGGGVTDTGAATYTLPLWVPEGPGGMQPTLAITYGSRNGNGHFGAGMSLAGLSAITPCGDTFAADGSADGVDYDADDHYCLDGTRLVEVDDADYEGPSARVFHTEIETFSRIVALSDPTLVQPVEFQVHDRDGIRHIYRPRWAPRFTGVSAKQVEISGRVAFTYLLAESVDPSGNRVAYTYEDTDVKNAGEVAYRIQRIEYSYVNGTPRRMVRFLYADRLDPQIRYLRGVKLVNRSLVRMIQVFAPNPTETEHVWTYSFGYQSSTDAKASLLSSVQLCAQLGSCSHARRFEWTEADALVDKTTISDEIEFDSASLSRSGSIWASYHSPSYTGNWIPSLDTRVLVYDHDNDGRDDLLYRVSPTWVAPSATFISEYEQTVDYAWHMGTIKLRTSDEGVLDEVDDVSAALEHPFEEEAVEETTDDSMVMVNLGKTRLGDRDRDGNMDVYFARTEIERLGIGYINLDHWSQYQWHAVGYSLPFDMRGPVLVVNPDTEVSWKTLASPPFQHVLADLDGDGQVEEVIGPKVDLADYPGIDVVNFDWSNPLNMFAGLFPYWTELSTDPALTVTEFDKTWTCGNAKAQVIDLDGSGRESVLVLDDDGSDAQYSRMSLADRPAGAAAPHGDPEVAHVSGLWAGRCKGLIDEQPDLTFGDWNGDGLIDALYPRGSYGDNEEPLVRWNLGNGFGPIEPMPVHSADGFGTALDMYQAAPLGKNGREVPWDRGTRTADVNNDGKTDIIAFRQDTATCVDDQVANLAEDEPADFVCSDRVVAFLSTGTGFEAYRLYAFQNGGADLAGGFTLSQIGDVTGDGAVDAIHVAGGRLNLIELPWRHTPDRLKAVRDDGTPFPLEEFGYHRQWWGTAAEPRHHAGGGTAGFAEGCAYPLACSYRGFEVVRHHRVFAGTDTDGDRMTRSTIHTYEGFWSDRRGRGGLGVAIHRIWDRELGVETVREFNNDWRIDTNDTDPGHVDGGEFYPGAHTPARITVVVPIADMPGKAALQSPSQAPGLPASTIARVTRTSFARQLRTDAGGRILTSLPHVETMRVADTVVDVDVDASIPTYGTVEMPVYALETTTTRLFDAHGSPVYQSVSSPGGITRTMAASYDADDFAMWRFGQPTRVALQSYDLDDERHPTRVIRTEYDDRGLPTRHEVRAFGNCALASCMLETIATTHDFTYDARGNVLSVTATAADDPVPRTRMLEYDDEGISVTRMTDPMGATLVSLMHPALGVELLTQDEVGSIRTTTYDPFGRPVTHAGAGIPTSTVSYATWQDGDRRGQEGTYVDTSGVRKYVRTDELGRTIETASLSPDATWARRFTELDVAGAPVRTGVPSYAPTIDHPTVASYDRLGRTVKVVAADGGVRRWNHPFIGVGSAAAGMLETEIIDAEGHRTFTTTDLGGRVIASGHHVDGMLGGQLWNDYGTLAMAYGPFDRLESVVDGDGNMTSFGYDAFGRTVHHLDPDTGASEFAYNGFGELVSETDADGITTTMAYDALGRAVVIAGPDGVQVREFGTTGTSTGRLVRATSNDGVVSEHDYDALGRLSESRQIIDGTTDRVNKAYDDQGRLAYVFYPETAGYHRFTAALGWGPHGMLRTIADVSACDLDPENPVPPPTCVHPPLLWSVVAREPDGRVSRTSRGAFTERRVHDAATGRLSRLEVSSAAGLVGAVDYRYDLDGLLRQRINGDRTETFEHDPLHRLTDWDLEIDYGEDEHGDPIDPFTRPTHYGYDPLGNLHEVRQGHATIWSATFGGTGRPHLIDSMTFDGLLGPTTKEFDYDASGHQVLAGNRTMSWTSHDQPLEVVRPDGTAESYTYGAGNQRVIARDGDGSTTYVQDVYQRHTAGDGNATHTFLIRAETGVVAEVTYAGGVATTRHVVNGDLATPAFLIGPGAALERTYYAPFGTRVDLLGDEVPIGPAAFGYTGHEEDGGGLINMGGRIYDTTQFRFVSPDPFIGRPFFGQDYNRYSYVLNSPMRFIDPSGFQENGGGGAPGTGGHGNDAGRGGESGQWDEGEQWPEEEMHHENGNTPSNGGGGGSKPHDGNPSHASSSMFDWSTRLGPPAPPLVWSTSMKQIASCPNKPTARPAPRDDRPSVSEWEFSAPEWDARNGRIVLGKFLQRGTVVKQAESLRDGLILWHKGHTAAGKIARYVKIAVVLSGGVDLEDFSLFAAPNGGAKGGAPKPATTVRKTPARFIPEMNDAYRLEIFDRQGGICAYCPNPMTLTPGPWQMQVDHVWSFKVYGPIHPLDGVGACPICNNDKGDTDFWEWRNQYLLDEFDFNNLDYDDDDF